MSPAGLAVVVDGRCTACGLCLLTCPERALLAAPGRPRVVEPRCTACLACVEVCPVDAISEVRWRRLDPRPGPSPNGGPR